MPTFVAISLSIAGAIVVGFALIAIDLWVRRQVAKGKYIVREKPCTLCSSHMIQVLRVKKGWDK